jgi:ABC-2 type transport system permease protein
MRNLFLLARNTIKITFRKRFNIFVYLILPVLIVLFVMKLYGGQASTVNIGICNKDINGRLAKDFIQTIKDQDRYKLILVEEKDINSQVADSKVDCVITIPENFEDSVYSNTLGKLDIVAIKGVEATGFIQNFIDYYLDNISQLSKAANGNKATFDKLYDGFKASELKLNTSLIKDKSSEKQAVVQSVGFLIMFMLQGASTTAGLILKEKKERTYYRIFSTPVSSKTYIAGNILANMFIMMVQSVLVVYASKYVFNLTTGVPDIQLVAILFIFALVCVTLGILLVAFSNTTYQSGTLATLITIPTCMVSGCWWPRSLMPDFMQNLSNFLPQTWALKSIEQLQNGKAFSVIIPYLGIIFAFAVAFFLVGMYKLKNNNNVKSFI